MPAVGDGSCRHGDGGCWRVCHARRQRGEITITQIALLTGRGAASLVGLAVAVPILDNTLFGFPVWLVGLRRFRSTPGRELPDDAGEALQLERFALPPATRRSTPVESAQPGIDGALVGLGAQFVCSRSESGGIDRSIVPRSIQSAASPYRLKGHHIQSGLLFRTRLASWFGPQIAVLGETSFVSGLGSWHPFPAGPICSSRGGGSIGGIVDGRGGRHGITGGG